MRVAIGELLNNLRRRQVGEAIADGYRRQPQTDDDVAAATMDNILAFPKSMLTRRMGAITADAQWRICDALAAATDC